jgi:membrane protein DedA with SNARE-associated domain
MAFLASAGLMGASGTAPLPGFLSSLAGPLDHYGYWAIALLLLLENIGIPVIPGELALIAGAIFAGTGRAGLNVVLVGIVAVCASFAGAEIGYLIGKYAGRELILHYGKYVLIKPHHLDRAEAITSRYGGIVVVVARFIVGLREANGIIAGITQMRWITFMIFNAIGACAWVATWLTLGEVAGDHIATIYANINRYFLYVLIVVVVLLAAYIARRLLRRRRAHGAEEAPGAAKAAGAEDVTGAHGTTEVNAEDGTAGANGSAEAEAGDPTAEAEAGDPTAEAEAGDPTAEAEAGNATAEANGAAEAGRTGSVSPEGRPQSS